jgi:eukaryotic-like serine/threonine-protein kinase
MQKLDAPYNMLYNDTSQCNRQRGRGDAAMSDRVGEQFGDYRLTRKLGGGTFGDVYLGEHTGNNTPAAVKILQARLTNSEDLKDYINEIRSLFRLQHPNIVPLLDFGIERDTPFSIMAYAPNGTLRQPRERACPWIPL